MLTPKLCPVKYPDIPVLVTVSPELLKKKVLDLYGEEI